jgi:hypothetical protein
MDRDIKPRETVATIGLGGKKTSMERMTDNSRRRSPHVTPQTNKRHTLTSEVRLNPTRTKVQVQGPNIS